MSDVVIYQRFRVKRDTAASFTSANTLLLDGEFALETDTRKMKLGDGVTTWNMLAYLDAAFWPYDNATSGLAATDVQAAVDELSRNQNFIIPSAVGDGSTDDTAAIQAAIDLAEAAVAAGAQAISVVLIPAGTYMVDPLYIDASNVKIIGEGDATVLKRKAATVTNTDSVGIINAHGTSGAHLSGICIESLKLDGNKANITIGVGGDALDVECLSFTYVDSSYVRHCRAINSTSEGFDFDYCSDVQVEDCHGESCDGNAIHFSTGCVRMRARGCTAYACGAASSRGGFDFYTGTDYSSYEDCHARSCYRGFMNSGSFNMLIGCSATSCTNNGIRLDGDFTTVSGCRAHGTTAGNGMTVTSDFNSINGGVFYGSGSSSSGIVFTGTAANNSALGVTARGNAGYGVSLSSGASNNVIVGCQLGGNTSGGINDLGTSTTQANNKT